MNLDTQAPAQIYRQAALRSTLVAKLTGLTRAQLQYWHEEGVQIAEVRPGSRGTPRLYSWRDYQRLRVIAKLLRLGVPFAKVRAAVEYMDATVPDWFTRSLLRYDGSVPAISGSGGRHVGVRLADFVVLADAAGQVSYRDQLDKKSSDMDCMVAGILGEMAAEGPLFLLNRFDDAIRMQPEINVGLPTLLGTRLESSFIAGLVAMSSEAEVARMYRLEASLVHRAVEFEAAA
ncbi:MAG: MerR family transcriptional regulator [Dehalococcoidia bacterium]